MQVNHHRVAHQLAHGHKPFVRLVAPLHFGRAVKHIVSNVVQFVHKTDGLFGQTAVRGAASCLWCTVGVVAHAFFSLGRYSVFSLWFRAMRDNVYQFVHATFHYGIGIAQHSVKHSFHGSHTIWFDIKLKCCKGNTKALHPTKKVYNLYTNNCALPVNLHVNECVCFHCHLTLFARNKLIYIGFKSVRLFQSILHTPAYILHITPRRLAVIFVVCGGSYAIGT